MRNEPNCTLVIVDDEYQVIHSSLHFTRDAAVNQYEQMKAEHGEDVMSSFSVVITEEINTLSKVIH